MKIFLNGGGSGKKALEVYKIFNNAINHDKPILYVPLAMDNDKHPYSECYEWVKEELKDVDVPKIEMVTTFAELINIDFNNFSAIFIGGGNTFKLLKGLKDSGAFEKIKEYINNEGIIFGGSAGAIIFGYDITSCGCIDKNDVGLTNTKGFDLLNGKSILAHYTNTKSKLSKEENEKRTKDFTNYLSSISHKIGEIIALPEEDTIFIDDGVIEIIGSKPYYTFNSGIMVKEKIQNNHIK